MQKWGRGILRNTNKNKGFTLIELLAVIVIIAVIALIAIPIIGNIVEGALTIHVYEIKTIRFD